MFPKLNILFFFFFVFNCFGLQHFYLICQVLPEVIIQDSIQTPGWNIHKIDLKPYLNRANVSQVLEDETGWTLKNYGGSGLVTGSARGSSSQQILVEWNGISLQNPWNGTADFQLFPLTSHTSLSVQNGANSWSGSGAIGGVVQLKSNVPDSGLHTIVQANFGQWSKINAQTNLSYRKNKLAFFQGFQISNSKNNFPYFNSFTKLYEKLAHAEMKQYSSVSELYFIGNQDTITIKNWAQRTYRNISPTFTQIISEAKQEDQSDRMLLNWAYRRKTWKGYVSFAYLYDFLRYEDDLSNLNEKYKSNQYLIKNSISKLIGNHYVIEWKLDCNYTYALAARYIKQPSERGTIANALRVKGYYQKLQWQTGIKIETIVPEKFTPLMPFLGLEYQIFRKLFWKISGSSTYRIPTFNDWFWEPGGNPNLLPEDGWNVETAFSGNIFKNFNWQLTHYQQFVSNWIQWQPQGSYFSPQNIAKVWSKGLEAKLIFYKKIKNWQLKSQLMYQFCSVTKIQSNILNDQTIGKQLIYTPLHKGSHYLDLVFKKFSCRYSSQFSSFRWTDVENTIYLEGYWIHTFSMFYELKWQKSTFNFSFECRNFTNQRYQVLENRAMPGREFMLSLIFQR